MNMVNNHFYLKSQFGILQDIPDVFCFQIFLKGFLFRVSGEVRVRDGLGDGVRDGLGDGFRVRVRDRAGVRASGGFGFLYNCRNMVEIKLCPSGIFEAKYTAGQSRTVGQEQ